MGVVKQALRPVPEIALGEFSDQTTVAHVGDGCDQSPAWFKQGFALIQKSAWLFQVLKNVGTDNTVVTLPLKQCAKVVPVQVGYFDMAIPSLGNGRLRRIERDAVSHNGKTLTEEMT